MKTLEEKIADFESNYVLIQEHASHRGLTLDDFVRAVDAAIAIQKELRRLRFEVKLLAEKSKAKTL